MKSAARPQNSPLRGIARRAVVPQYGSLVRKHSYTKPELVSFEDDLGRAYASVRAIVAAERLRRDRRPGLHQFVTGLLDETD